MNFGQAIEKLTDGHKMRRGFWVKMFIWRGEWKSKPGSNCIWWHCDYAQRDLPGWVPNADDIFADDWEILGHTDDTLSDV